MKSTIRLQAHARASSMSNSMTTTSFRAAISLVAATAISRVSPNSSSVIKPRTSSTVSRASAATVALPLALTSSARRSRKLSRLDGLPIAGKSELKKEKEKRFQTSEASFLSLLLSSHVSRISLSRTVNHQRRLFFCLLCMLGNECLLNIGWSELVA